MKKCMNLRMVETGGGEVMMKCRLQATVLNVRSPSEAKTNQLAAFSVAKKLVPPAA